MMSQYSSRAHLVCTLHKHRSPRLLPPLRCQVLRYLPEKQRYTLELLEPLVGGGGVGQRMDVRPANFVLAHLPAGTRCAS